MAAAVPTAPGRTIEVVWPDGSILAGASYREVEDALRATQWTSYRTRRAFREEMRRRAGLWSGARLHGPQTSRGFVRSLAGAGMCIIHES